MGRMARRSLYTRTLLASILRYAENSRDFMIPARRPVTVIHPSVGHTPQWAMVLKGSLKELFTVLGQNKLAAKNSKNIIITTIDY